MVERAVTRALWNEQAWKKRVGTTAGTGKGSDVEGGCRLVVRVKGTLCKRIRVIYPTE